MSSPQATFHDLTEALVRLTQLTGQMPGQTQSVMEQEKDLATQKKAAQAVLVAEMQAYAMVQGEAQRQNEAAAAESSQQVVTCMEIKVKTSQSVESGLGNVQAQIFGFGDEFRTNLVQQYEALGELNGQEAEADYRRLDGLRSYHSLLGLCQAEIDGIQARLAEADNSFRQKQTIEINLDHEASCEDAVKYNQAGILAYEQGKVYTAYTLFERANTCDPANIAIGLNFISLCLESGHLQQAIDLLFQIRKFDKNSQDILFTSGLVNLYNSSFHQAQIDFNEALNGCQNPIAEIEIRLWLAEAYFAERKPQQAIAEWKTVLKVDPFNSIANQWINMIE